MAKGVRGEGVDVQGDLELVNLLRELPRKVQNKGLRAAMAAMTTPIARAAKAKAKRGPTGLLGKSIGKKVKTGRNGVILGLIGARRSVEGSHRGKRVVPANYIHLVELGTAAHAIGSQQHPGSEAQPFLEPAYREQKSTALALGQAKLKQVVETEAVKLGKR